MQLCELCSVYEAMSSISTHAPAADAASATTASDRIIVAAVRCARGREQSFSCCPKSKQRAGRASSAKSRLRMPLLGCSARMPTDGSRWRAGSLKRLLVVAFAPRLRQCDVKCAVRVVLLWAFTATCIDTLGFGETRLNTVRFATGPKRSIRHLLGAKKINFFNSRN